MRYLVLAADYDGTLAERGRVHGSTVAALERARASGRRLVLVTGRIRTDLERVFPRVDAFDLVVAENGGTLWRPGGDERPLAGRPSAAFLEVLRARGVPFDVGHVIVATVEPHQTEVLAAIHELGLDLQIVFNKGAVMVLPPGVTKASGLAAAVDALGLTNHEVVAIGDAENDLALLAASECAVAVANALPAVQQVADIVTLGERGDGVAELVDALLADDLASVDPPRHHLELGTAAGGRVALSPAGTRAFIAGAGGSGTMAVARGSVKRLAEHGYQVCVLDPAGRFGAFPGLAPLGSVQHAPEVDELVALLAGSRASVAVSLLAMPLDDRPGFLSRLWPRVEELRATMGRPHWVVVCDAHELLPRALGAGGTATRSDPGSLLLVSAHPDQISPEVLRTVNVAVALGEEAPAMLRAFSAVAGQGPVGPVPRPGAGEVVLWRSGDGVAAVRLTPSTLVPPSRRAAGDRGA